VPLPRGRTPTTWPDSSACIASAACSRIFCAPWKPTFEPALSPEPGRNESPEGGARHGSECLETDPHESERSCTQGNRVEWGQAFSQMPQTIAGSGSRPVVERVARPAMPPVMAASGASANPATSMGSLTSRLESRLCRPEARSTSSPEAAAKVCGIRQDCRRGARDRALHICPGPRSRV
jgi:hypothetical protein